MQKVHYTQWKLLKLHLNFISSKNPQHLLSLPNNIMFFESLPPMKKEVLSNLNCWAGPKFILLKPPPLTHPLYFQMMGLSVQASV